MRALGVLAVLGLLGIGCGDDEPGPGDAGGGIDSAAGTDATTGSDTGTGSDATSGSDAGDMTDATVSGPVDPFEGIGTVELVQGGFGFLEGPVWRPDDGVLLFSDLDFGGTPILYSLTPPSAIAPFRDPSFGANGNANDTMGNLLTCEHDRRQVSRTLGDGTVETFAGQYMGMAFNSPNDVVVRSDGTVYFTDPPYGLGGRPREIPFNGLFRVAPDGTVFAEVEGAVSSRPNGVALSPDEAVLYLADTDGGFVRRYDVATDGALSGEATFASDTPGADGMAMDVAGNLYVTTSEGVKVYAPDGTRWGTIDVPMGPANCGFGDADMQTLYITARQALYSVRLTVRGVR